MGEWKENKLSEFIFFGNGKERPRTHGFIPVFGGNGILGYCDKSNYDGETIIIGRVGAYCGSVYFQNAPVWISDNALAAKPKKGNSAKFFYYYLKNLDLNSYAEGSSHPLITQTLLNSIDISIPSDIKTQTAIAEVLSSLDDKIDLLHRQNKTLEQIAETLFRQWFVEEAEEGWEGNLSEYIMVQGGFAFKSKDFKQTGSVGIIKIKNISMGFIDIYSTEYIDETIVKNIDNKFKVNTGDFLIAMTGAEIGKIGIVEKTNKEIWLNQRVGKLIEKVPFGNLIGYLALKSKEGQEHIANTCSGSAQENISSSGIEQMNFIKYSKTRCEKIGFNLIPVFDKIQFNYLQIQTLKEQRETLLPKLMSGEIGIER